MTPIKLSRVPHCFGGSPPSGEDCSGCDSRYKEACTSIWRIVKIEELEEKLIEADQFAHEITAMVMRLTGKDLGEHPTVEAMEEALKKHAEGRRSTQE